MHYSFITENVVVLDYENEYPNLIIKHNLSYKSVTLSEEGKVEQNHNIKSALLPTMIENIIERRNFLKNLRGEFVTNTPEWSSCQQRIDMSSSFVFTEPQVHFGIGLLTC
jgi:DNA polymerase elongation subunit (family B)